MTGQNNSKLFHLKRCILLLLVVLAITSCKKFVEIPPPVGQAISSQVFTSDDMARSAITGIYSEMMNYSTQFSASGVTCFAGMSADELFYFGPGIHNEFTRNEITESSHTLLFSYFWERAYKYIYTANLCLEGLGSSTNLSAAVKNQLTGECRFIRAFCYFHLVNLFGPVPLPTISDYETNAVLPRSPVAAVYDQMIADLKMAKNLLSIEYPSAGRVRPNKWTATALLARIHLYRDEWAAAESEASEVIGAGIYALQPELNDVFLGTSAEAIWQLLPVGIHLATWEGNLILPLAPSVTPTYLLTDTLANSFEPNDQRKIKWTQSRDFAGQTYYYPYKYKIRTGTSLTEHYMVLRLAEQYLIRAEARAQQNKLTEAAGDIDMIRNRAGLVNTMASTQAEILNAIEQERKIELLAEWGHRWYDLKRTGRADSVLGNLKPLTWTSNDTLWPIPSSQIRVNPMLTQNPGY